MGDKNYRENLKNQIKEACGKVIYTYTAHHKLADRLEREDKRLKSWQIILTAASSGGFLAYVVAHDDRFIWLAAAASFISLALNLYTKEYRKQNEIIQHRNAANELWEIRESYVSLITDFAVLEDSEIRQKRDELCQKVSDINKKYPATDKQSYIEAQKALKENEEQTFNDGEVDALLPREKDNSENGKNQ
jgi:vacuolar-type H+-ATPase subunit I/STV1